MKPIKFAAKKLGWSQSDKGFVLRLLVAADDDWEQMALAPLGSPFGVAMVPIDPETGVAVEPPKEEKPRVPFVKMKRAQQAGILANDATFQLWFSNAYQATGLPENADCAEAIRAYLGVPSRSDIDEFEMKALKWDRLVDAFRRQTGQEAEQRG